MFMAVKLEQFWKVYVSILVTPSGITIPSSDEQFMKAPPLMLVTPDGILTLVRLVQPLNRLKLIVVKPVWAISGSTAWMRLLATRVLQTGTLKRRRDI